MIKKHVKTSKIDLQINNKVIIPKIYNVKKSYSVIVIDGIAWLLGSPSKGLFFSIYYEFFILHKRRCAALGGRAGDIYIPFANQK